MNEPTKIEQTIHEEALKVLNCYALDTFEVDLLRDDNYDPDDAEYETHYQAEITLNENSNLLNTPRTWYFPVRIHTKGVLEFDGHEDCWTDFDEIFQWLFFSLLGLYE